jgi:hypothetical protein
MIVQTSLQNRLLERLQPRPDRKPALGQAILPKC